jgi:hypothetical protein
VAKLKIRGKVIAIYVTMRQAGVSLNVGMLEEAVPTTEVQTAISVNINHYRELHRPKRNNDLLSRPKGQIRFQIVILKTRLRKEKRN